MLDYRPNQPANDNDTPAPRIRIDGLGLITPLTQGAWPNYRALLDGRSIADRAPRVPKGVDPVTMVRAVGAVASAVIRPGDPAIELAETALREAATDADVPLNHLPVFVGSSKGAIAHWALDPMRHPLVTALGPHGYLANQLATRTGCSVIGNVIAACASSLVALDLARRWLLMQSRSGDANRATTAAVVTSEAALVPLFIHSYRKLGVLAPTTPTGYRQRPLSTSRQGFMLGQIGCAMVLRLATKSPEPGDIDLLDSAVGGEANDIIRPSPTMDALAHLALRLVTGRDVDVLHPHAPGTVDHDPIELARLIEAGRGRPMKVYANKGALGHSLGAAGLTSLVIAALSAKARQLPPMPWLDDPMPVDGQSGVELTSHAQPIGATSTHAAFAAGFGGHVAGAVIRKH